MSYLLKIVAVIKASSDDGPVWRKSVRQERK